MLLEKRLCTSTQLKTELIEDAEQMEIFNCQHPRGLHCLVGQGHPEDSWSRGVCRGGQLPWPLC